MPPKKDKSLWEFVDIKTVGRPVKFKTYEEMWEKACAYFAWSEANPLQTGKRIDVEGKPNKSRELHERPFTIKAMCVHMGIGHQTWNDYCKKDNFSGVTKRIDDIIYAQKSDGASAGLFNPNIIARDLGLAEKTENKNIEMSHEEALKALQDD